MEDLALVVAVNAPDDRAQTARDTLCRWAQQLADAPAVPVLCVGVGTAHEAGQVMVFTGDTLHDRELIMLLQVAIRLLRAKLADG